MVKLRMYSHFRDIVGEREIEVPADTVREILRYLCGKYEAFSSAIFDDEKTEIIKPYVKIFVNGQSIGLMNGLDTAVKDTDDVVIFPPVGGG